MSGDRKATLTAILQDGVSGPARKITAEIDGIGASVGRVNTVLAGVGLGIGEGIFNALTDIVRTVTTAIPKAIEQGNSYLDFLHRIQQETGDTAEATSLMVGTMRNLGVPIEDLQVLFARLGKNVGDNEGKFRALGVATRDTDGNLLSTAQIVENLRQRVQAYGPSLLSTAAAQDLLGRSGYELLRYFEATPAAVKAAQDSVRSFGGVFTEQALAGATALSNTLGSLQAAITTVGGQIAGAIDPYLQSFVVAFEGFIKGHLRAIVDFAIQAANTVIGFVSGLLGITASLGAATPTVDSNTDAAKKSADAYGKWFQTIQDGAAGTDAFSKAIQAQIKAIDAHSAALAQAAERRRAIQERQKLADSLAAAQAQLADLRGNAPFLGGLSAGEQALAVQKHAQDILDAERNVSDQRTALGNFEADQKDRAEAELARRQKQRLQDNLTEHKAADAAILGSALRMDKAIDTSAGNVYTALGLRAQDFEKSAASAFAGGVAAAKSFLDVLLGAEHTSADRGEGTFRTGGIVGAIGAVGGALGGLSGILDAVKVIAGLFAAKLAVELAGAFMAVGSAISRLIGVLGGLVSFVASLPVILSGDTPQGDPAHNGAGQGAIDYFRRQPANAPYDYAMWGRFDGRTLEQGMTNAQAINALIAAGYGHSSGGWVGLHGPELGVLGENGPEYVLPANGGRGGSGVTIQVYNDFLSVPTDDQVRQVTEKISRRLAFNLANTGMTTRSAGSF